MAVVPYDVEPETLDILKNKEVKGVIVHNPFSYRSVNESTEILDFLKMAKDKDISVILGLEPVETDKFLFNSENKHDGYVDYYIWADSKGLVGNKETVLPNNWVSLYIYALSVAMSCICRISFMYILIRAANGTGPTLKLQI